MDTPSIRKTFLDFFAKRSHKIVPSSSLVPDDPTLLLTNAGMVQFKPYFLGEKAPAFPRAASVQKCFREIDLEEVGKTNRHLTFFEMLGNFSFGDYFKQDACKWAWELMTEGFGLDPGRLWATVYAEDEESARIWESEVGVPPGRILRRTREEGNFWDMGVAGPCGPCSELLYDRGEAFGHTYDGANLDEERYLEVWNLVFMQHLQNNEGEITGDLPTQNVDTGMGLERLASILQDVPSAFEIDSVAPILRAAEEATGRRYGQSADVDVGLRVISEHSRSMTFLIADGVFPGNVGRGYVLRRLIRRALRHARLLGIDGPILARLTDVAVDLFQQAYPEVDRNKDLIRKLVEKEETRFDLTHRQGLGILEEEIKRTRDSGAATLSGEIVFRLHDTYGFPLDLTMDIAADEDLVVDREEFERLMSGQRDRARTARGAADQPGTQLQALSAVLESSGQTEFAGYDRIVLDTSVLATVQGLQGVDRLAQGAEGQLVLAQTPFYPQGGGQVGDRGAIRTASGTFAVESTRWGVPGVIVHQGRVASGEIIAGEDARALVDPVHRDGVTKSHTATHMIHWTLRDFLGEHAKQQGSLVEPGRLHFDFSHFEAIPDDRLAEMEEELNRRVLWDDSVRAFETTFDYATSIGAMALFGEKYGDHVRVVEVGDYSKELCGGTHVSHTGQVGVIKVLHEGSVGAGVRRVEALTGLTGLAHLNEQAERLKAVAQMLKSDPERVIERLEKTLDTVKSLEAQLADHERRLQREEVKTILRSEAVEDVAGFRLVSIPREQSPTDSMRKLAVALRDAMGPGMVILGSEVDHKASVVVAASRDLIERGLSAQSIVDQVKSILGGGGGGRPELAVAGGPNTKALGEAMEAARQAARQSIQGLAQGLSK